VTLNKLIRICNKYYDDGYLAMYWNFKKSKPVDTYSGDTLALFIVREISDTYRVDISDKEQIREAARCMNSASEQLSTVTCALDNEFDRLVAKEARANMRKK
jgi:hypothetical protein